MKRKLQILAAFTTLLALATAVGCKGFFVDPTLTTLSIVPPTPSVEVGKTVQLTAIGSFDDGSTKTLTSSVIWSSADIQIASIATTGILTGVNLGTTTITATSTTAVVSSSTSVTVSVCCVISIAVSPTNPSVTVGTPVFFTAIATVQGGGLVDVTSSAQWLSSNTLVATIDQTGTATTLTAGTTLITASTDGITSPAQTLTVF